MNGLLVPPQGLTSASVQPVEVKPQTPPDLAPPVAVPAVQPVKQPAQPAPTSAPAFVVDFSGGVSAGYVLDWRDPRTHSVLVQVPMRTAFAPLSGAATPEHVGTHIDTTV